MANLNSENIGLNYKGILNLDSTINTPLDATLRAITDGEGNVSGLKLSTTDSSFSGKVGIGTDAPTKTLDLNGTFLMQGGSGTYAFDVLPNGGVRMQTSSGSVRLINSFLKLLGTSGVQILSSAIIGSETTPTSRLQIVGSGTTSATTALLVQNSASTNLLTVLDDGNVGIGTNAPTFNLEVKKSSNQLKLSTPLDIYTYLEISGAGGQVSMKFGNGSGTTHFINNYSTGVWASHKWAFGSSYFTPSAQLHIKGSGTTSSTTSLLVQNSAGVNMIQVTDDITTTIGNQLNVIRTNVASQLIEINANFGTIAAGIRAGGNNKDFILSSKSRDLYLSTNFNTSITQVQFALKHNQGVFIADDASVAMAANTKLHIKGSGTTSSTTSLLVQNSAGSDLLKLTDDGEVTLGNGRLLGLSVLAATSALRFDSGASLGVIRMQGYSVGMGNNSSGDASALLTLTSTIKGFLPPRMTTTQRDAIATPASGLVVYDNVLDRQSVYTTAWQNSINESSVSPNPVADIWSGTQAEYNALTPIATTLYFIV